MIRSSLAGIALCLVAGAGQAGTVTQAADPAALAARLSGVQDFEALALLPEPGRAVDRPIIIPGLAIGERFAGQRLEGTLHDVLSGRPTAPLSLAPARPGTFLSTAYHPGFGSNALFPVGPVGFPAIEARGEGAVALLFGADIRAVTLKVHAAYGDPLGTQPAPKTAMLTFYARAGAVLDRVTVALQPGVMALGFTLAPDGPGLAGITLTNDDPGGLALDDIRFPRAAPSS